jgi:hypothetical protein
MSAQIHATASLTKAEKPTNHPETLQRKSCIGIQKEEENPQLAV